VKLLVVGFDGAGYNTYGQMFVDRLKSQWKVEAKAHKVLSPIPLSGTAWTSVYTGLPASVHGVTDVWARAERGSKCHGDWINECFWNKLDGKRVASANMPMTYPPSKTEPFFVAGFSQQGPVWQHPNTLRLPTAYKKWSDVTNIRGDYCKWLRDLDIVEMTEAVGMYMVELALWHGNMAERLGGADLYMVGHSHPDKLLHAYGNTDLLESGLTWRSLLFEYMARSLDASIRLIDPDRIIIISDHGFEEPGTLHTPDALLVTVNVDTSTLKDEVTVCDIAPLVLEQYGVSVGRHGADAYSPEEWEVVKARMVALGYFEE